MKLLMRLTIFTFLFISCFAFAATPAQPILNQVSFQLKAEQWASTQSAKVTVMVNASLNTGGLEQIHAQLLKQLTQLSAQGEWHITRFYRNQDQSGLENLQISAEARLPNNALANLRDVAKKISKPGETFTIQAIDYSPSLMEVEKVRSLLRNSIYQQAQDELTRLNKIYPDAHFTLHAIDFNPMQIMPMARMTNELVRVSPTQNNAADATLAINDKITMMANIQLASVMHANN
ncbi:MAG: hypothetical protein KIT27_11395 [Legionellales bacterium]|nr:hypothetical protein [Legionellales bacterium]